MYSVVKSFVERLGSPGDEAIEYSKEDTRVAIAVLYYRVIMVDGRVRPQELDRYRQILSDTLSVSEDELELFEEEVLDQAKGEMSLFPFTSIIRRMPLKKRREILKHMQQISLSDFELHEFEINLVERTAELLGLKGEWIGDEDNNVAEDAPKTN